MRDATSAGLAFTSWVNRSIAAASRPSSRNSLALVMAAVLYSNSKILPLRHKGTENQEAFSRSSVVRQKSFNIILPRSDRMAGGRSRGDHQAAAVAFGRLSEHGRSQSRLVE